MIVREFYEKRTDGVNLFKTYSDKGMKIRQEQTNVVYDSAIDVEGAAFTYVETDEPIELEEGNGERNE